MIKIFHQLWCGSYQVFCNNMSLFFALPECLLADFLSNWLPATTVCRLDSACCNKHSRPALLRALGQTYFLKSGASINELMFRWMMMREIQWHEIIYGSRHVKKFGDNALKLVLATTCQSVTSFTFRKDKGDNASYFEPTERSILLIPEYCPDLRTLSCFNTRLTHGVSEVISECSELQEVNFGAVSNLPEEFLEVCFSAPKMKTLKLIKCTLLGNMKAFETSATIQSLHIMQSGLSARQALKLCEHCPNLVHLSIEVYQDLLDVTKIAQFCPLLKKCVVANCCPVDVPRVEILCRFWKALTELTVYHKDIGSCNVCSEDALLVLVQNCPTLQYLCVNETPLPRVVDQTRPFSAPMYSSCSQLRELVVGSLTTTTVKVLLAKCLHLHSLHVIYTRRSYQQYNTTFVEDSLDILHSSSVKKLILEDTVDFTDEHLLKIAQLEELELQCISGDFSAQDIITTIHQCPDLHTLVLSFPPPEQIARTDIRSFLDAAPKLRTFVYADREDCDSFPSMEALREMRATHYPHIKSSQFTSVRYK